MLRIELALIFLSSQAEVTYSGEQFQSLKGGVSGADSCIHLILFE
jgi:hypothetical protein